MTETAEMGGLFGALRNTFRSSASTAKSSMGFFANPELWAVRLAALAGVVAIYVKSGAPTFGFEPVVFALAIGLSGLMFEASSAKNIIRSAWQGRAFGIAIWSTLWISAFTYSAFNWVSVAAENESEKTNVHAAANFRTQDVRNAVQDAGAAVLAARAKAASERKAVESLHNAAWEGIPTVAGQQITSAAQAQALIDKAKGNGKFWKMTDGCTDAQGPKAREFCSEYAAAKAALADVQKREEIRAALAAAEANVEKADADVAAKEKLHRDAQAVAANTKVEAKATRADVELVANVIGISGENKEAKVEQAMAVFKILAVSVFLSLGAMMLEIEKLRAAGPRRPFGFLAAIGYALAVLRYRMVGGEKPVWKSPEPIRSGPTYVQNTSYTLASDEVSKNIQAIVKCAFEAKAAHG